MKKTVYLIVFSFLSKFSFSQTKIYILYDNKKQDDYPWSLVKASDSAFITFTISQDMGRIYSFGYEFSEDIKDGYYQIFINNTLKRELYFKNHTIDRYDKSFFDNGKVSAIHYFSGGKKNGVSKTYYPNGQLQSFAEYKDDFTFLITEYYQNNKVKSRTFSLPDNSNLRTEFYDENGRIKAISDGNVPFSPIVEVENNFNDGFLDGTQTYVYQEYSYKVEYNMNELIKFTLRKNGVIVKEQSFR